MRAAVGEELDHLDLLARLDRLRVLDPAQYCLPSSSSCAAAPPTKATRREEGGGERQQPPGEVCIVASSESPCLGRRGCAVIVNACWAGCADHEFPRGAAGTRLLDHRGVEAALGELALDAVELVDVVVGPQPDAIAHGPCPAASPAGCVASQPGQREPRLQVLGVGLGGERARLQPEALGRPRRARRRLGRLVGGLLRRPRRPPCRRRRPVRSFATALSGAAARSAAALSAGAAFGCTFGSSTPGRIL